MKHNGRNGKGNGRKPTKNLWSETIQEIRAVAGDEVETEVGKLKLSDRKLRILWEMTGSPEKLIPLASDADLIERIT